MAETNLPVEVFAFLRAGHFGNLNELYPVSQVALPREHFAPIGCEIPPRRDPRSGIMLRRIRKISGGAVEARKWALIAEIVGTVAIVATLVILVVEVRQNTEATRIASFDALTQSLNDWRSDMLDDPDLFELLYNYGNGVIPSAGQDGVELAKLRSALMNIFTNFDRAYVVYRNDGLGRDEWNRFKRGLCGERDKLLAVDDEELKDGVYRVLTSEFIAYMDAECD